MADILKQTLYFNAVPTETLTDINGTGPSAIRSITAAESHDASDATYYSASVTGDGSGTDGYISCEVFAVVDTASTTGGISFVRVKARARVAGTGSSGTWQPRINGTARGTPTALTASFADYTQDFTTDPADSNAWTNAKVNAQTFGVYIEVLEPDANFPTAGILRFSEFEIQLWGPSGQTSTPATHQSNLNANNATGVAGLVSSATTSHQSNLNANDATGVAGAVTGIALTATCSMSAAQPVDQGGVCDFLAVNTDPSNLVPLRSKIDTGFVPVTIRSFKASLGDQTTATRDIFTSPASWPNGATELQALYGAGAQGIVGNTGAGNGINGEGLISGIKLHAIVRVAKNAASSITNIRFGTGMGVKSLMVQPTIRDYAVALTEDMWEHVETDVIALGATAQPFEWGNGVNSVWSQLFGWTFNHTYSNVASNFTQVEIAEAWVEVIGPAGATLSDPILVVVNSGPLVIVTHSELA